MVVQSKRIELGSDKHMHRLEVERGIEMGGR